MDLVEETTPLVENRRRSTPTAPLIVQWDDAIVEMDRDEKKRG